VARYYFSGKYLHAIFNYGFAVHGTNDISRLGGPASHRCVRLHPANAPTLFAPVERNGRATRGSGFRIKAKARC
jgi:lipoprotein-anchoring transpeptidase ErfK/SrfK